MFEIEALPDAFVHAQFVLHSNAALPSGARRLLIVDIATLRYCERPDLPLRFGAVLCATVEPVPGLAFTWLAHRARGGAFTPEAENALQPRYDEQRFLTFQLENVSGAALSLPVGKAVVTLLGVPLAPRPLGVVSVVAPALPDDDAGEIEARTLVGVTLAQNWSNLP